jgi:hypothetical protein
MMSFSLYVVKREVDSRLLIKMVGMPVALMPGTWTAVNYLTSGIAN